MRPLTITATSPAQTADVAVALAPCLRAGDVLILSGELAAGKTYFVQNLVRALGSCDDVLSPTFAIANFYETAAAPFIHVDAYRLSGSKEYADLGLDEYAEAGILAVEWGERLAGAFSEYLSIEFRFLPSSDEARVLMFRFVGERWTSAGLERLEALAQ